MQSEPTQEHAWLRELVGSWAYTSSCFMGPDKPAMEASGREVIRALGELWIVCENEGRMPDGQTMHAIMTLGYDPARQRFVGTWIGSPMTHMFLYEGQLDDQRRVLPLETTGPSMVEPTKTARYRDVIEVRSPDERAMYAEMLGDDGAWFRFMSANYRRA